MGNRYKNNIVLISGRSASGKTTIYNAILERKDTLPFQLKTIPIYTTRPMRPGEESGTGGYCFISKEKMDSFQEQGKVIESRTYPSIHGDWTYATIDDGTIFEPVDQPTISLMNNNVDAFLLMRKYVKDHRIHTCECDVFSIYMYADNSILLQRQIDRELKKENPDFEELLRRYKYSTSESVKTSGFDFNVYYNIDTFMKKHSEIVQCSISMEERLNRDIDSGLFVAYIRDLYNQYLIHDDIHIGDNLYIIDTSRLNETETCHSVIQQLETITKKITEDTTV